MPFSPKIVLVGGGGVQWTHRLVRDLLMMPALAEADIVLHDIDRAAAEALLPFFERLQPLLGTRARITATDDTAAAFAGARYFIIAISTGGLDAMEHDIAIPERHGIRHTVGDTSGPGGWARFFRNYPVFVELARDINRHAPGAVVLNYTNPMTTLTDTLARHCAGPVVGLCHALFESHEFIEQVFGREETRHLGCRYAGLNHFFWMTEVRAPRRDLLAELREMLRTRTLMDLVPRMPPDPAGFVSQRHVADELFRRTGVFPYIGDRHTCEFFPDYITSPTAMERYQIARTSIAERRRLLEVNRAALARMIREGIPNDFLKKSRESAADMISAHWTGAPFIDVGNVPNVGQIDNLPRGTVVETDVRIDASGFTPLAFGALPPAVLAVVAPWAEVFNTMVHAAETRDAELALRALRLDPVCAKMDDREVRQLGLALLAAHERWTSRIFHRRPTA